MSANLLTIISIAGALILLGILVKIANLLAAIANTLQNIEFHAKRIPLDPRDP